MERSGPRLKTAFAGSLAYGIKTGLNEAFIIDSATRNQMVAESPAAEELVRPMVVGDDIRRYEIHSRDRFLIYTYHSVAVAKCQAILRHLKRFRSLPTEMGEKPRGLDYRATKQEWWELQQPQKAYEKVFLSPKILYPDIGKECRFVLDHTGLYPETTGFAIGAEDWYLLGLLNSASAWRFFKEECQALGDKDEGGRLRLKTQYIENLPIPDASAAERKSVGALAKKAQALHGQRRSRVEKFLRAIGLDPAQSTSRNPLERPWTLSSDEFARRAKKQPAKLHESACDETAALTKQIAKVEAEIDARVAALYGLDPEDRR